MKLCNLCIVIIGLSTVTLMGCGGDSPKTYSLDSSSTSSKSKSDSVAPVQTISSKGTRLVMYDESIDIEDEMRPTFIVEAASSETTSMVDKENEDVTLSRSVLTNPKATIYTADGNEFTIDAQSGEIDDESQTATLLGEVNLLSGTMNLIMDKMVWRNTTRTVESDTAVDVISDWASLKASSMVLDAESGLLTLDNVTGSITLGDSE